MLNTNSGLSFSSVFSAAKRLKREKTKTKQKTDDLKDSVNVHPLQHWVRVACPTEVTRCRCYLLSTFLPHQYEVKPQRAITTVNIFNGACYSDYYNS